MSYWTLLSLHVLKASRSLSYSSMPFLRATNCVSFLTMTVAYGFSKSCICAKEKKRMPLRESSVVSGFNLAAAIASLNSMVLLRAHAGSRRWYMMFVLDSSMLMPFSAASQSTQV